MARTSKKVEKISNKGEERELCYCEKGIFPRRDPRTEYRCPQCGRVIWPAVMGGEAGQNR